MIIWVDADACPKPIKAILIRNAQKRHIDTYFIANHLVSLPPSAFLKKYQVAQGFDMADNAILQRLQPGDILVSQDIPLAAEAITIGAKVITPRGERYTEDNIAMALSQRNAMTALRDLGLVTGGVKAFSQIDSKRFADNLTLLFNQHQL